MIPVHGGAVVGVIQYDPDWLDHRVTVTGRDARIKTDYAWDSDYIGAGLGRGVPGGWSSCTPGWWPCTGVTMRGTEGRSVVILGVSGHTYGCRLSQIDEALDALEAERC